METRIATCTKCKLEKPDTEFNFRSDTGKPRAHCKVCVAIWAADHYKRNKPAHRKASRKYSLKKLYGMSFAAFEQMAEAQGHCCKICKEAKPLHVDHDHYTGVVRGLLCRTCNTGLGDFKDRPDLLWRAFEYLKYKLRSKE